MNDTQAALIYAPFPDAESARSVAGALLEDRLIACANILGAVESVFVWNGKRESATECAVLFKTTSDRMDQAVERLGALHPYETPAIVANICGAAHVQTLEWLAQQTR